MAINSWGFFDSFLYVADSHASMLNLNDCAVSATKDLRGIRGRYGSPTVLLTQFSYAAWKGGKANKGYRLRAAEETLDRVAAQATALDAEYLIPMASFIYFSHEENQYLNDAANGVSDVLDRSGEFPSQVVVMKPYDSWKVGGAHENDAAVRFWNEQLEEVTNLPKRRTEKSFSVEELEQTFREYQQRIYSKNSRFLIWLARYNPVMRGFLPLRIRLTDLNLTINIDLRRGITTIEADEIDVEMHSSSLMFILKNEFGFDTLLVNGRFEASVKGFSKMTRFFAIGLLNNMGITFGASLLWNLDLLRLLRRNLARVLNRLIET